MQDEVYKAFASANAKNCSEALTKTKFGKLAENRLYQVLGGPGPRRRPKGAGRGIGTSTVRDLFARGFTLPKPQVQYGARPEACPRRFERPCIWSAALSPV